MPDTKTPPRPFEQVLAEHREFKTTNENLREYLERPRPPVGEDGHHRWAAELSKRLAELHDKLVLHFRHEEQDGFFQSLTSISPGAERQVQKLSEEHIDMLAEVRALMSTTLHYSEGHRPAEPHMRRRLVDFLDQLNAHELEETDLLQRLQYRVLGAGD
jgi:iron-sulfur cluster repair protein YtfE (RIC family)